MDYVKVVNQLNDLLVIHCTTKVQRRNRRKRDRRRRRRRVEESVPWQWSEAQRIAFNILK